MEVVQPFVELLLPIKCSFSCFFETECLFLRNSYREELKIWRVMITSFYQYSLNKKHQLV